MSEETNCYLCSVYADGVQIATAQNRGHGGPTDLSLVKGKEKEFQAAIDYVNALPPETHYMNGEPWEWKKSLDDMIDCMVEDYLRQKNAKAFKAKIDRACKTSLVAVNEDMSSFYSYGWKKHSIAEIAKSKDGKGLIERLIGNAKLDDGWRFYNLEEVKALIA